MRTFVHHHPDFDGLVDVAARAAFISKGLAEKDYWVTHVLWSLQNQGLDVWFKGGTSLSKGFGLIERFSEDIDVKIGAGSAAFVHDPSSWQSQSRGALASREAFFTALQDHLDIDGCTVHWPIDGRDRRVRAAELQVQLPPGAAAQLAAPNRPFVLLEVGDARVRPCVRRDMTSWVHDALARVGRAGGFIDNRPRGVRCLHPIVTALEKLDAIMRRWHRVPFEPASFVRHYEDIGHIVSQLSAMPLPPGFTDASAVMATMKIALDHEHPAWTPDEDIERWRSLRAAHLAIGPMFWGKRMSLEDACRVMSDWIVALNRPAAAPD